MTTQNTPPLKAFFEPKTLTELGALGHTLTLSVDYEVTDFDKVGLPALARKLPVIKSLTPFKSDKMTMDIDLSCVVLNSSHQVIEKVWYGNVRGLDDAIRHVGGLCGARSFEESLGSQESISVRLDKLPADVQCLMFVISSYHKYPLNKAKKGKTTLADNDGTVIYEFDLDTIEAGEYGVMAWVVERSGGDFKISAPQKALGGQFNPTDLAGELDKLANGF